MRSLNPAEWLHGRWLADRRVRVLSRLLAPLIPARARILDVGSGDGRLAAEIGRLRTDLELEGVDVLVRLDTAIATTQFDGEHLPFADGEFDGALLVDVLHHADDPVALLVEVARVARRFVLLKDHQQRGFLARPTLRFMDGVGNARFGVALPHNYLTPEQWSDAFVQAGLETVRWLQELRLYPPPASWIFDRQLHFIAMLTSAGDRT